MFGHLENCRDLSIGSTADLWERLFVAVPENGSVVHLDDHSAKMLMSSAYASNYKKCFDDKVFTLIVVHELTVNTLPLIKLADYAIFLTQQQKEICEKIVGLNIPNQVLPYPIIKKDPNPKYQLNSTEKKQQVLFLADWNHGTKADFLKIAKTWKKKQKTSINFVTTTENPTNGQKIKFQENLNESQFIAVFDNVPLNVNWDEFAKKFKASMQCECEVRQYINRTEILNLMSESEFCYIYNKEMDNEIFNREILKSTHDLIYTRYGDNRLLADALSNDCKVIIAEGISTVKKADRPIIEDWHHDLTEIFNLAKTIKFKQKLLRSRTPIDTPRTMEIHSGDAINVDYAFVIIFRNQKEKIGRAIQSVLKQNHDFNYGLVIVDDASDDGSIQVVDESLANIEVPYVVVQNKNRRYHSRNLWNAVRFLIQKSETVIIELDGDDFLEDVDVLSILDKEYKKGILKTAGKFRCFPDRLIEMEANQERFDIENPWHQGKCSVWIPLRTYKKSLFLSVEIEYFLERDTKNWLTVADDASIGARMIELANRKISVIDEILYVYDVSGINHDAAVTGWTPWHSFTKLYHGIIF